MDAGLLIAGNLVRPRGRWELSSAVGMRSSNGDDVTRNAESMADTQDQLDRYSLQSLMAQDLSGPRQPRKLKPLVLRCRYLSRLATRDS